MSRPCPNGVNPSYQSPHFPNRTSKVNTQFPSKTVHEVYLTYTKKNTLESPPSIFLLLFDTTLPYRSRTRHRTRRLLNPYTRQFRHHNLQRLQEIRNP